ncbi:MAG TPA: CheR family methyltransferase [Kofleriaceae bacterium]|nr:CheR family methyltransferase [Kofleriaceae bacterium]
MNTSPQLFTILSGLVEERVGLHYGAAERDVFLDKVAARALEAGFDSLLDYYYRLRYDDPDGAELDDLVEALVVHETYFFRELDPLVIAIEEVIGPRLAAGGRARIWSAACSTGEEPLTAAMLLEQRGWLDRVEVVATDVSRRALARAQRGEFSPRSLRGRSPDDLASRWLRERPRGVECDRALIDAIRWSRLNLFDGDAVARMGSFDLILCRNVLIYFADQRAAHIARSLAAALRPSGVLLVGVSESLMRFATPLECQERRGAFLYARPAGTAP